MMAESEQWVNQMDVRPRGQWVYGYAICRECVASPHPEPYWLHYVDDGGRCYCRDCAPVTPSVKDGLTQAGLEEWS